MIGSVATNRRAHAFAQALDERSPATDPEAGQAAGEAPEGPEGPTGAPETDHPEVADDGIGTEGGTEHTLLLALADGLGALPRPELDPEVKTVQRAQLIAAMESAFAEGTAAGESGRIPEQRGQKGAHRAPGLGALGKLRPKSRLSKGIAAGGLGVGVAASAFGGVAAASTNALPGDSLYGVKRGMEDIRLDLTGGDTDRGQLYLDRASTRLQEARRLLEHDRAGALDHEVLGSVRKALSGMSNDASEGHRLLSGAYERDGDIAPMRSLNSFSESHRSTWSQLKHRLPVQLTDVGDEVSSVFDAIESDVGPLEQLLEEDSGVPEPGTGPLPGGDGATESSPSQEPSPSVSSSDEERPEGEDSRSPSPSGSEEPGGLLGEGGLLNPEKGADEKPSGSAVEDGLKAPDADITLPPIVPEVLPGLNDQLGGGK
ncbi:DUF5667 domain-containing protein [Streptomyces sp. HNM0574]|uniref:DUF5667 domain-containing protein n=1 Tax=Streptomyces sp. HNM0574 TaxID=2714954 RepID=UPI00146D3E86|nr:DUF5667 domain-containing protein [Streptomyces sp. HNM0574]NLU70235.1 hypothetical protein [Streptomyces sp. HNM0574]